MNDENYTDEEIADMDELNELDHYSLMAKQMLPDYWQDS